VKPLVVGFLLCSGGLHVMPSTRIAVLNMFPYLVAAGITPRVLLAPEQPSEMPDLAGMRERSRAEGCDIVVFQKVRGAQAAALAAQLREDGVATVFAVCDRIDVAMAEATDATVVVTDHLRSLYPAQLQHKVQVVHDGIERPDLCKTRWHGGTGSMAAPLAAVLVTSSELMRLPVIGAPPSWLAVQVVGGYAPWPARWSQLRDQLRQQRGGARLQTLRFLGNPQIACVPWGPATVYEDMARADIGIIPIEGAAARAGRADGGTWALKSENRLTLKMSMGLPVIATPIPAYESVIEHGVNGFFAHSRADWRACLAHLRDPARRRAMGEAARASVAQRYSMAHQAERLVAVLGALRPGRPVP
jgi:hypothetical protein